MLEDLTPADLGLPKKFTEFRPIQDSMVQFGLYGQNDRIRRVHALGVPPGGGKSVGAHAIGRLSGGKYAVLTVSLSLSDQYLDDGFAVTDIRGKKNYTCFAEPEQMGMKFTEPLNCEQGEQEDCPFAGSGDCHYHAWVGIAKEDQFGISSNYQYWMSARRNRAALEEEGGGNPIQMLIGDEAHLIPGELSRHLGAWFSSNTLQSLGGEAYRHALGETKGGEWGKVGVGWLNALGSACARADSILAEIADEYGSVYLANKKSAEYRKLDKIRDALIRVVRHGGDNNWIWHWEGKGIKFDCIWPRLYAEQYLWQGIPRIVLMSATLRPKTLNMLGIKTGERWFKEWPRVFPAHYTPIYWVPTGRMGKKASEDERGKSVERFDEIFALWGEGAGKKGIVHVPSYDLAVWMRDRSRFGRKMILNEKGEVGGQTRAATEYREKKGACALVSPSFTTGYNFPDEECEWIHIPKLPWPYKGDPVVQARCADDETYYNSETMQQLVQSCFRGTRHDRDKCTVIITDDAIGGFRWYAKEYAPQYFKIMERAEVPRPRG
jgi:Rad3-related DNA helicase